MMKTGTDSLLMRKTHCLLKTGAFYACKSQIMPQLYPLSHNRNTAHHHIITQQIKH